MQDFSARWPGLRADDLFYVIGNKGVNDKLILGWLRHPDIQQWLTGHTADFARFMPYEALKIAYLRSCEASGREPQWIRQISRRTKRELRWSWLASENFDPLALVPYQKHLGFGYAIHLDGFIHDVCSSFGVFRLEGVCQLGMLRDPVLREAEGILVHALPFTHNRYQHSLGVGATAGLESLIVKLSSEERKHLVVAGCTHDVLTPAGGDSIKMIDPQGFDEDFHYPEVFQSEGAEKLLQKYSLSREWLTSIVAGEGVLGMLLDIADKCTYVQSDVQAYIGGVTEKDPYNFQRLEGWQSITEVLQESVEPICALWELVRIVEGRVVILDGVRFGRFLKLRALLFKHLYGKKEARYYEQVIGFLITDYLYASGILTRERLLQMSDEDLHEILERYAGPRGYNSTMSQAAQAPDLEEFASRKEAEQRQKELAFAPEPWLSMIDYFPTQISDKMMKVFVRKVDRFLPFAEAYPHQASEILAITHDPLPYKLYTLNPATLGLPEELKQELLLRQQARALTT